MTGGGIVASFYRYSVVFGLVALALAGCKTIAEKQAEDARKRAAPTAVVVKLPRGAPVADSAAPNNGGFPDFNTPLTAANVQISDTQATDMRNKLNALAAAHKAGTITQAQYDAKVAEMRKLADDQQQTLQEIQR